MLCWRCGAQVQGNSCLACGCLQNSRHAAASEFGAALRYAYDKLGARRMLTDSETFRRCLSDMLPDEPELRQQLTAVMQTPVGPRLFDHLSKGQGPGPEDCRALIRIMETECRLPEPEARDALLLLLDMIGCGNPLSAPPAPQPAPPVAPAPQPAPRPQPLTPGPAEISRQPQPAASPAPAFTAAPAQLITALHGISVVDATRGAGGMAAGAKQNAVLFVRTDGVSVHRYRGGLLKRFDKRDYNPVPELFIPRGEIVQVIENFFLTLHEFTIVTRNGTRYRVMGAPQKGPTVNAIQAIRSLI